MKAKEKTEEVLKSIHVLFSKAEPIEGSKKKVIIDKERMLTLIKDLNVCMYDMMDEYELSKQSQEKAMRKVQKQSDELVLDARKNAEDIYAASFMYTDNALDRIHEVIKKSTEEMNEIHARLLEEIAVSERSLKDDQMELKNQLAALIDTQKYLRLIENENARIQREKERKKDEKEWGEEPSKKIVPNIIINEEYFKAAGLSTEVQEDDEDEDNDAELSAELDAEYFEWKEEQENNEKKSIFKFGRK